MRTQKFFIITGSFIFGAIALFFIALFILYHEYIQGKVETYVLFFNGSLEGLDVTSAINYRGVKVGEVTRIELTANRQHTNVAIPVYATFFIEKSFVKQNDPIQILIENGYTAVINPPNILTGRSSIELIQSNAKQDKHLLYSTYHQYPRFPTADSAEQNSINANNTLRTLRTTLHDISDFLRSPEVKNAFTSISTSANHFSQLSDQLSNQLPNSLLYFNNGFKEIGIAAYSFRNLSDFIARHPEALLRGK